MTHSMDWLIENRVLYSRVWGIHTLEDIRLSNDQLNAFLAQGTPLIHLIIDAQAITKMSSQLVRLQNAMQATRSPALGWVISVGMINPATKYAGETVAKLFRLHFRRVENIEGAIRFLKEVDSSIHWEGLRREVLYSTCPL